MYSFHTDDHAIAQKIAELLRGNVAAGGHRSTATPPPSAPAPLAAPPAPLPPGAPPVYTPVPPGAPPVYTPVPASAPVAPAPAAAVPPPPAPAPAAPAAGPDAEDQAAIAQGWTVEHVKQAMAAFAGKHGNAGPTMVQQILAPFMPGVAKPSVPKLAPKYWAAVHKAFSEG